MGEIFEEKSDNNPKNSKNSRKSGKNSGDIYNSEFASGDFARI
jgi:hypothetical protein